MEEKQGKPYRIGYIMGVFDLFHVGHLNLIRRAKGRCEYLMVGVLTDALVREQKKHDPVIPFAERVEILRSIRYVDEVVTVDDGLLSKVAEWYRHPYDCLFSGSDHEGNPLWEIEKAELETLGSTIEFFPYTKTTNSTKIRALIGMGETDGKEAEADRDPEDA